MEWRTSPALHLHVEGVNRAACCMAATLRRYARAVSASQLQAQSPKQAVHQLGDATNCERRTAFAPDPHRMTRPIPGNTRATRVASCPRRSRARRVRRLPTPSPRQAVHQLGDATNCERRTALAPDPHRMARSIPGNMRATRVASCPRRSRARRVRRLPTPTPRQAVHQLGDATNCERRTSLAPDPHRMTRPIPGNTRATRVASCPRRSRARRVRLPTPSPRQAVHQLGDATNCERRTALAPDPHRMTRPIPGKTACDSGCQLPPPFTRAACPPTPNPKPKASCSPTRVTPPSVTMPQRGGVVGK